jgi:hypothetical protein
MVWKFVIALLKKLKWFLGQISLQWKGKDSVMNVNYKVRQLQTLDIPDVGPLPTAGHIRHEPLYSCSQLK